MKEFNIEGTCFPQMHYMVDITDRLENMKKLIQKGKYFCINRGRQYGKTTTINALCDYLKNDYAVFSITFEGFADYAFETIDSMLALIIKAMYKRVRYEKVNNISEDIKLLLKDNSTNKLIDTETFKEIIEDLNFNNPKPVVLIIDEVDKASNYESFITFLEILRASYLSRNDYAAFQSVILASVYDIKNLKQKIPDSTGELNSPWNIAASFEEPMEFDVHGIAGMLREYSFEHKVSFDIEYMAQEIENYTGGYPFLVSKICKMIDENNLAWNRDSILKVVKMILKEKNTLWDDLNKKLQQFPKMDKMFKDILYNGVDYSYSHDIAYVDIAERFGYIREHDGRVCIANRIFEPRLYEMYWIKAEYDKLEIIACQGARAQFVQNGKLDMELILEKFTQHYNDIYSGKDVKFLEAECRKMLMLYIKPIINGTGNYYIEAETRDGTRTDMVIDYLEEQFILEMKIWHGDVYQQKGEKQLAEYLERFHVDKGYLVTFNFNKGKNVGRSEKMVDGKKIIEFVV